MNQKIKFSLMNKYEFLPSFNVGSNFEVILSGGDSLPDNSGDVAIQTADPELKRPSLFQVVLMNDDFTPMEFVVYVLEQFFAMNREKATQVMLNVHTKGKGICGVYTKDIAETKAALVNDFSRENQHPLLCEVEEIGDE
ncbi:ATP-dependent Clp protease adapter ClpS [Reinekea marinisedimentorum]|nr:ATP-dependent Clp protease adapter ClpS [Reinekea marinisedimentorum]